MATGLRAVAKREAAPGLAFQEARARGEEATRGRARGFFERGRARQQVRFAIAGERLDREKGRIEAFKQAVDLAKAGRRVSTTAALGISLIGSAVGLSPLVSAGIGLGGAIVLGGGEPPAPGAAELGTAIGGLAARASVITKQKGLEKLKEEKARRFEIREAGLDRPGESTSFLGGG